VAEPESRGSHGRITGAAGSGGATVLPKVIKQMSRSNSSPALLIVDDSPTIRKMIRAALKPLDAYFGEAGSGLEAIEQLVLHPFHAITLDLNMPDMHGIDFIKFVRGHDRFKNIPIVVISTRSDELTRTTVLSSGASAYITKPFTPQQLLDTMSGLINFPVGSGKLDE
jgi:two-component system, chemotaxis family, chemotaxis protein CheY